MLAGEGLHPSSKGARVRFSGGKRTVIDGPFAETKELIAGYWLWQCKSKEEAVEWVMRCPNPYNQDGEVEIRQGCSKQKISAPSLPPNFAGKKQAFALEALDSERLGLSIPRPDSRRIARTLHSGNTRQDPAPMGTVRTDDRQGPRAGESSLLWRLLRRIAHRSIRIPLWCRSDGRQRASGRACDRATPRPRICGLYAPGRRLFDCQYDR